MSATAPKVNGRLDHETEVALANGLALALAAFQGETPTFPKTKTAEVRKDGKFLYSYKYADLGDILPVVGPLLAKHGLSWSSKVGRDSEGELVLRYRLLHVSGECDHDEMPLGVEKRCKPQELGSAITYARRYALTAQLNLATEEDDDGAAASNGGHPEGTNGASQSQPSAAPPKPSERPASAKQRSLIEARARTIDLTAAELANVLKKAGGEEPTVWQDGAAERWSARALDRLPARLVDDVLAGIAAKA